jgi:tetratricopeptide (TPR) repeat protein
MVWSLRGSTVCYLAAAMLLVLPMMQAPAAAQAADCLDIDDCTPLIRSGKYTGKDLAHLFSRRCIAYSTLNADRAIADCNEAIRLNSLDFDAFDSRGLAYLHKGDYDHAIADYSEAIKLAAEFRHDDLNPFFLTSRARAYLGKGDYDHAITDLDRANPPASRDALTAEILFLRGDAYYMKGDNNRAIASYDTSLKVRPTALALYGRGLAKLKNGDGTGGNADIAAAKALQANVADEAAGFWKGAK